MLLVAVKLELLLVVKLELVVAMLEPMVAMLEPVAAMLEPLVAMLELVVMGPVDNMEPVVCCAGPSGETRSMISCLCHRMVMPMYCPSMVHPSEVGMSISLSS